MTERQIQLISAGLTCFVSHAKHTMATTDLWQLEGFVAPTVAEIFEIVGELGKQKLINTDKPTVSQSLLVDVYDIQRNLVYARESGQVKIHFWKDYGSLVITVTDEGNIILDSVDGDGEPLETSCIDPDDFVGKESEDDDDT